MERLRRFSGDGLGFAIREETPGGSFYQAGAGTCVAITRSSGAASGSHTQVGFAVASIDTLVADLRARGAAFEAHETPKTVGGVAEMPAGRAGGLRDPDGNLIGMIELHHRP